jgi:hypothetical protein
VLRTIRKIRIRPADGLITSKIDPTGRARFSGWPHSRYSPSGAKGESLRPDYLTGPAAY